MPEAPTSRELFDTVPVNRLLGLKLVAAGGGAAEIVMPAGAALVQETGLIQGGMLTALADTTAAYALGPDLPAGETIAGIEASMRFLRPAIAARGPLQARAQVLRRGRTVSVVEVEVAQRAELVAKGTFTFLHVAARAEAFLRPEPGAPGVANVEVKARCRDLAAVRARALDAGAVSLGGERQVDTYFVTRAGRLKLRESDRRPAELIPYERADAARPRNSTYRVIPVADARGVGALLAALLGVHRVVTKEREVLLVGHVRIHLDRVAGLGDFVEIEAVYDGSAAAEPGEQARVRELLAALHVSEADFESASYEALVAPAPGADSSGVA